METLKSKHTTLLSRFPWDCKNLSCKLQIVSQLKQTNFIFLAKIQWKVTVLETYIFLLVDVLQHPLLTSKKCKLRRTMFLIEVTVVQPPVLTSAILSVFLFLSYNVFSSFPSPLITEAICLMALHFFLEINVCYYTEFADLLIKTYEYY